MDKREDQFPNESSFISEFDFQGMVGDMHNSSILHASRTVDFLKHGIKHASDVSLWFSVAKLLDEHIIQDIPLLMPDSEKNPSEKADTSGYSIACGRLFP